MFGDPQLFDLPQDVDVALGDLENEIRLRVCQLSPRCHAVRLGLAGGQQGPAVDLIVESHVVIRKNERGLVRESELVEAQTPERLFSRPLPGDPTVQRGRREKRPVRGPHIPVREIFIVADGRKTRIVSSGDIDRLFQREGDGYEVLCRGASWEEAERQSQRPALEQSSQQGRSPFELIGALTERVTRARKHSMPIRSSHSDVRLEQSTCFRSG